jgi:cytochrome c biogenesis protein CcdA
VPSARARSCDAVARDAAAALRYVIHPKGYPMLTADLLLDASLLPAMGIALVAGLLSFLSPCVLPIVPPYLA